MEYSIDNGNTYYSDSIFANLPAGSYVVMIRDLNGCEGFYDGNPVILADIPGPQVLQVITTNETDGLQNGSIDITATGSTPALYYSIDTLAGWQPDDGLFENLSAGIYTCFVRDDNGCDTVFTVAIQNIILTWLQAVTGPGEHCLGNAATVPVEVDNFTSVSDFQLKISYNKDNLQCQGYTNIHPQLVANLTGWVDIAAGEITLQWSGNDPVTFTGQQDVADLVFTTLQAGQGMLDWYTGAAGSYFTNPQGNPIPAEFHTGQVNIYEPPDIFLSPEKTVCEGQMVSIMGFASGNQPPFTYLWTYPDGTTTENDPFIFGASQANAGDYTLLVTDVMGCTDQKSVHLEVSPNPVAAFHGTDTLEVEPGYILSAGAGLAHYLWNTGDTMESIEITAEGRYAVGMASLLGCVGKDSIYLKITSEELPSKYFYVPNAFTPDGDGNNDIFYAFPNDNDISHFSMQVFDRWGGRVFSSDDISQGWDGKKNDTDCPGGVYVYRITFRVDGVEEEQVLAGTVAVIL
jgi:gliding motility-associated-like protein